MKLGHVIQRRIQDAVNQGFSEFSSQLEAIINNSINSRSPFLQFRFAGKTGMVQAQKLYSFLRAQEISENILDIRGTDFGSWLVTIHLFGGEPSIWSVRTPTHDVDDNWHITPKLSDQD